MHLVTKRDGRKVKFNPKKIEAAVLNAFAETDGIPVDELPDYAKQKASNIALYIQGLANEKKLPTDDIQDLVQQGLMSTKRKDVAAKFIEYRLNTDYARTNTVDKTVDEIVHGTSAYWNNENIQLKKDKYSNEILEANIDRYNNLETNREVTIEGFDPGNMRDERILNRSEIAYGIGYLSIKHVESLFDIDLTKKNSNNEDIINEIGYGILGIITQTRNSDLSSIKKMKSALDKNLTEVLKGITTVNDDINNVFKKILVKPQKTDNKNKRNSYEVGMSTNFKYLSYFASIWVLRYKLGMSLSHYTDDESNENISKTLLNLPMYYVYDTLAKSWRSSGDSRLNGYYIEDEDTHKTKRNYLHRIDKKQFDAARDSFIAEDMDSPSINFNAITRAIITIHAHLKYEKLFKPAMNYDFEHVVARSLLSSSYKKERVAAGSIGNGVYLESKENIRKRESNLWDDKDNSNNSVKAREMINSILREKNSMHYPDKAEYSKIMDKENKKIKNYNELKKMIKNREKNIFNDIYELLYVSR